MPSYPYEQLNDESFQELSQSLLLKEFPGLQCFPVGQPDGGRDATFRIFEDTPDQTGFILFQVKFARRELSPSEAREWLLRTLRNELPKVRKQMAKGAKCFVLVTNVAGTSHSAVGSIDKLQSLLNEHMPIPSQAWWRDDIDRRLDNNWDLKFVYPALFSGQDFLRIVAQENSNEDQERRQNAITAFLSSQFETDREVKFKQADLENDVFELFTDVPLIPRIPSGRRQGKEELLSSAFGRTATSSSGDVRPLRIHHWLETALTGESNFLGYYGREEVWMGAASLLLDSDFQKAEPLVLLEGAPGQGKSTIAQYICQVHRMHFLDRDKSEAASSTHFNSSLRLPFKVELRDFASWLAGGNPFGKEDAEGSLDTSSRSLDKFLAAHIRHASGGSNFNVSDLQTTLGSSPALIVLDGLDEVADIKRREQVVEEITITARRLSDIAKSLQIVVTSRPTAFVNSPVLPRRTFATYSLDSMTKPLITEYAERWLRSREIDESSADDVRQILNDKLSEPHLHDLARNPMQLAILLSLIHRRGVSLPDKRTALYDSYIEIFFDRESEKAAVVRDNRDLLIRIHRYLAWELQSRAEVDNASASRDRLPNTLPSGSITEEDLIKLLGEFLEKDGSDAALVEQLFSGLVERVVAIVSRVQGVYEFDVQTLREYFAARHLYETAPYSPAGNERRGTISDRWRALSRNYYWLNVARFYAGCYSEGELASLMDDLQVLSEHEVFRRTSHPQLLTATLLGDWVFSQRPRTLQDAIDLLVQPRGLRMLASGPRSGLRQVEEVSVGNIAGKKHLIAACKELVGPDQPYEQVLGVVRIALRPNSEPEELVDWWLEKLRSSDKSESFHWCVLGQLIQCWSIVDLETVKDLLDRDNIPWRGVIDGLIRANREDILENDEGLLEKAIDVVLSGRWIGRTRGASNLQRFVLSVDLMSLGGHDLRDAHLKPLSLLELLSRLRGYEDWGLEDVADWPSNSTSVRCERLIQAFTSAAERPITEWDSSIEPWNRIVQQGISDFGERRRFMEIANLAAGIRSTTEKCQDSPDLFDVERPLVRRARYARLRAGHQKWWSKQLQSASNSDEIWLTLLVFVTWAGARTIEALLETFDNLIASLEDSEWRSLYRSLNWVLRVKSLRSRRKSLGLNVSALASSLNVRTITLLAKRCTPETVDGLFERYLSDYKGNDRAVVSLCAESHIRRALNDETMWPQAIETLRLSYSLEAPVPGILLSNRGSTLTLPDTVAREIADHPLDFPAVIVREAETRCRELGASEISPVGRVAAEDSWFTD